jgi:hypothetical protein
MRRSQRERKRWARAGGRATSVVVALIVTLGQDASAQHAPRALTAADLIHLRRYVDASVSPDAQLVAIAIRRSSSSAGKVYPDPELGSDLVIVRRSGDTVSVFRGARRPSASWRPVWSPAGNALAFLVVDDTGRRADVAVWDRRRGRVLPLRLENVDLYASVRAWGSHTDAPMVWLDDTHLMVNLLVDDVALDFVEDEQSATTAFLGIRARREGRVATAIAVSSPIDSATRPRLPRARLVVVDIHTGAVRVIGEMPAAPVRAGSREIVVSPTHRSAAVVVALPPSGPDSIEGWTLLALMPFRLGVANLEGAGRGIHWVSGILPPDNTPHLTWVAHDSTAWVQVLADSDVGKWSRRYGRFSQVASIDVATGQWHTIARLSPELFGTDSGQFWIGNISHSVDEKVVVQIIHDTRWWTLAPDGRYRPIAERPEAYPLIAGVPERVALHTTLDGRLYDVDAAGHEHTVFGPINPQLDSIAAPVYRSFAYRGSNGDTLTATVLLPYNYDLHRCYPTVVELYAGSTHDALHRFAVADQDGFFNLLILAGHGYAVLEPSMPLPPDGHTSDPLLHLNDGVDPAVDRLIQLGIADSARLGLIGWSYGGYSVYGLLAQSHRYKAAIGGAGISDLISLYGSFEPRYRYTQPNRAAVAGPSSTEHGQMRMGLPVWSDPERYIRNSPVFRADSITTPLLLFHGDVDFFSTQDEELFTALYRLRRRAEFVRYLGEGHELESPANVLDFWQRVLGWYDRWFYGPPASNPY